MGKPKLLNWESFWHLQSLLRLQSSLHPPGPPHMHCGNVATPLKPQNPEIPEQTLHPRHRRVVEDRHLVGFGRPFLSGTAGSVPRPCFRFVVDICFPGSSMVQHSAGSMAHRSHASLDSPLTIALIEPQIASSRHTCSDRRLRLAECTA